MLTLDSDPGAIASIPLDPDPALADRLFHVAVLGLVLRSLRWMGWTLVPTGLPGNPDGKPVFRVTDPHEDDWDLWYEMSGAWSYYGVDAPYPPAVAGVPGTGGPLGADVALVRHADRALVIECKYSADPTYVGRNGYEQLLAYMTEARTGLVGAVAGMVVGPPETVVSTGWTTTTLGQIAVTNPEELRNVIRDALTGIVALP